MEVEAEHRGLSEWRVDDGVSRLLFTGESGALPDRPATGTLFLLGGGVSMPGKAGLGGEIFDSANRAIADSYC